MRLRSGKHYNSAQNGYEDDQRDDETKAGRSEAKPTIASTAGVRQSQQPPPECLRTIRGFPDETSSARLIQTNSHVLAALRETFP